MSAPRSLLVLGGTSEIAAATALALVERGTRRVVLAGRDAERLAAVGDRLERAGADQVELAHFDALEPDAHEALIDELFGAGEIDVALIAFGVLDGADARRVIETNFLGAVSAAVPVARRLRSQGQGVLVVLSSVAAERAAPADYAYAASKAGLDTFAHGLGDELDGSGARVMVVRPGFVRTKMTAGRRPRPWATTAEAVAEAIAAGLERGSRTVWAPPPLRWVMVVVRHLPAPLFRRLSNWAER